MKEEQQLISQGGMKLDDGLDGRMEEMELAGCCWTEEGGRVQPLIIPTATSKQEKSRTAQGEERV